MTKVYAKVGRGSPFSAVRFCGEKKKKKSCYVIQYSFSGSVVPLI